MKKVYQRPKKSNPVAKEILMQKRIDSAFDQAKTSAVNYTSIIASLILTIMLKKNNTMEDEKISEFITKYDRFLVDETKKFEPLSQTISRLLDETDMTIEDIIKLNPKLAAYIDAEQT